MKNDKKKVIWVSISNGSNGDRTATCKEIIEAFTPATAEGILIFTVVSVFLIKGILYAF